MKLNKTIKPRECIQIFVGVDEREREVEERERLILQFYHRY